MTLYRKYRPQKFSDVVGQNHVKKTLTNAIKTGKVGHAYLFSGPRGTGKTTSARLLAKSLNCQNRKNGEAEPCDNCISCKEIILDKSMDVLEIDAASNRGIDEIRELRDKIAFAPSAGRYKIYIIDEVHMLTREAFNALLKTLEEPPKHAIFIMATTELHKVPETILSRVQQFDFRRASSADIRGYLEKIIKAEKIKIEPEAVQLIANFADGSYRDSVSTLDQVSSNDKEKITIKDVQEILGIVDDKTSLKLLEFITQKKSREAISLVNQIYQEGFDLTELCANLIELLRKSLILKANLDKIALADLSQESKEKLININQKISVDEIFRLINLVIIAQKEIKISQLPQLPLEMVIIELTQNLKLKSQNHNLKVKIEEKKIENPKPEGQIPNKDQISKEPKANSQKLIAKSLNLVQKWPKVLEELAKKNHSLSVLLEDSEPLEIRDDKLVVAVRFKFYAERIKDNNKYQIISDVLEKVLGKKLGITCVIGNNKPSVKDISDKEDNELLKNAQEVFG